MRGAPALLPAARLLQSATYVIQPPCLPMLSQLARRPWYLLVLPLAVLLAALGYRGSAGLQGAGVAELAAVAVPAGRAAAQQPDAPPVARVAAEHGRTAAVGPGLPLDLRAAFEDGRDLYAYAYLLRGAAEAGNAEAGWIASRIYDYCGVYAMDPQGYALDSAALAGMDLDVGAGLRAARERVQASCRGFTAHDGLGRESVLQQRKTSARAGNLAAEAALLSMGEPLSSDPGYRRDLARRVMNSRDPEAFLAISGAMGMAAVGDDAYRGMVAGSQFSQLAWQVAACRLGMACGPGSALMNAYCANAGICPRDRGQDFESFVYDAAVPRQGVEKMDELVDSLRTARGGKR